MGQTPKEPVTPRQALLLLVCRKLEKVGQPIDLSTIHNCLNLIVYHARRHHSELLSSLEIPKPRPFPGLKNELSKQAWEDVIAEKLAERLMDKPEYVLTPLGRDVADRVAHGNVSDPKWFEPSVASLAITEPLHHLIVTLANNYSETSPYELRAKVEREILAA